MKRNEFIAFATKNQWIEVYCGLYLSPCGNLIHYRDDQTAIIKSVADNRVSNFELLNDPDPRIIIEVIGNKI